MFIASRGSYLGTLNMEGCIPVKGADEITFGIEAYVGWLGPSRGHQTDWRKVLERFRDYREYSLGNLYVKTVFFTTSDEIGSTDPEKNTIYVIGEMSEVENPQSM